METAMTWVRTESGEIREYRTPVGNSVVIVQCRTTSLSDISADWCAEIDGVRTAAIKVTAHTDSAILRHVEQRMLQHYAKRERQAIREAQKNREGWIPKKGRQPSRDFGFLSTKYIPYKTRKPQEEEEPWELERGGRPGF